MFTQQITATFPLRIILQASYETLSVQINIYLGGKHRSAVSKIKILHKYPLQYVHTLNDSAQRN